MILGRNNALWAAAVAAIFNVLVVLGLWQISGLQLASVDGAAFAIIGLIANASDPTTAPTFALTTKAPGATTIPLSPSVPSSTIAAPASSPGIPTASSTTTPSDPTGTAGGSA